MSLFSGGGSGDKLLALAQEQTEIVRVADLASSERAVRSATTSNLAASTSIAVSSAKARTVALIPGKSPGEKTLKLTHSSKTDTLLAEAASNNQYDDVFTKTLTGQLKTYQANVKKLFASSKNKKEKAVLESAYNDTLVLLGEHTTSN